MKRKWIFTAILLAAFIVHAQQFETIFKCNPLTWAKDGYEIDRSELLDGTLKKVRYSLKLTDKQDKTTTVTVSFVPPTQNLPDLGIPTPGSPTLQQIVDDLDVVTDSPNVKAGHFAHGSIEFWPLNYGAGTKLGLPNGSDKTFDFDDTPSPNGNYTSMQIHNYIERQVVMALNKPHEGANCELGIGNNTTMPPHGNDGQTPNPDWTFTNSGKLYKSAELVIDGQFENLKMKEFVALDPQKVFLKGVTDKQIATSYTVGEPIIFTLTADMAGQKPTKEYFITWKRTGDDGKVQEGKASANSPCVITTSLSKPGFVRIEAFLVDNKGRQVTKKGVTGDGRRVFFDGGAGAEVEKLYGAEEPADFLEFWAKQRARLAAVPLKPELTEVPSKDPAVKIYAVSIPCPGPNNRPCTGYLTIPVDAKPKSLRAQASFHGYGTSIQRAPGGGPHDAISFNVNAHGYDLGKDDQYYAAFFKSINPSGRGYAFDPKENENPETAYFNGMALRLMRAFEFLKSLPEWNGKDLVSHGGSQGGLQSAWAGALEPQLTQTNPGIPWCCDMSGKELFGRIHGGWRIVGTQALRYYDPINMAKHTPKTCFVNITRAGLGDYCCPPSGVAIYYNNIPGPKKIWWVQGSTHGYVPPNPNQSYYLEAK